jgi:hypothetical protein
LTIASVVAKARTISGMAGVKTIIDTGPTMVRMAPTAATRRSLMTGEARTRRGLAQVHAADLARVVSWRFSQRLALNRFSVVRKLAQSAGGMSDSTSLRTASPTDLMREARLVGCLGHRHQLGPAICRVRLAHDQALLLEAIEIGRQRHRLDSHALGKNRLAHRPGACHVGERTCFARRDAETLGRDDAIELGTQQTRGVGDQKAEGFVVGAVSHLIRTT